MVNAGIYRSKFEARIAQGLPITKKFGKATKLTTAVSNGLYRLLYFTTLSFKRCHLMATAAVHIVTEEA
jgi:hypothetical protein